MPISRFQLAVAFWTSMALTVVGAFFLNDLGCFIPPVVASLAIAFTALLIAATRPDDTWNAMRQTNKRLSIVSLCWTALAGALVGFEHWVAVVHDGRLAGGWGERSCSTE